MPRYHALVPAAGSGSRYGAELPKQYLPLAGRPLLQHTLYALCAFPRIERVWVVLSPEDAHWAQYDWRGLDGQGGRLETLFCGGASRAESVRNGLRALSLSAADDDWVLVHDAARPCLSAAMLERLIDTVADDPVGGLLAVPVADTLKRGAPVAPGASHGPDGAARVMATVPREGLWQAQTPQMFRYAALRDALAAHPEVTDEAGAIEAAGGMPLLVPADATNLKVTYPADLPLAELILRARRG